MRFEFQLDLDDVLDLHQKPRVDAGECMHFIHAHAHGECVADIPDALGAWRAEFLFQHLAVLGFFIHTVNANLKPAQSLLERLLEGAAYGHDLAHRLHLRGQATVGCREFFKRKARYFRDHVIDAGLKTRGRGAARDVVAQFVQRETHGQFGGHFGNRKAGGFGRQRRRARHARIHFNDNHAPVSRVDGELHVRAAGVHADFTQHRQTGVAQNLVFLVGQGLGRRDGDGVTCVHTHGVQVFDGTHDDAVVRLVAHHFHFVFFPAEQRFFNQQFAGRGGFNTALANLFKFFRVVGNAAAGAAQSEAWANNNGKADGFLHGPGFIQAVGNTGTRRAQTDFGHGVFELQTVFGFVNGFRGGTNQLHRLAGVGTQIFVQHAVTPQIQGAIECGLSAHGRQNRIRLFLGDDFFHRLPGDGLYISDVRRGRVGHDGGRVAVDQNDLVAFLAQGLASLHAGIIKFAGLTDDDWPCAYQQNAFNVCAFSHAEKPPLSE